MQFWIFDLTSWLTWASVAAGLVVTLSILWFSNAFWPRPRADIFTCGEMPWEQMLELLKSQQGPGGQLPEAWNELPSDQLLRLLLRQVRQLPKPTAGCTIVDPDEASYLLTGKQRRAARRRWLNPTEITLTTAFNETPLKGLVINRSDGGLAILTDSEHAVGALLFVRSVEAPNYIASATMTVRHARPAGKLWLVGCQYADDVPWNVKVWFG